MKHLTLKATKNKEHRHNFKNKIQVTKRTCSQPILTFQTKLTLQINGYDSDSQS